MGKQLIKLNVTNDVFKKLKKHKKVIYVQNTEDTIFENKSNIMVINDKNKKLKRKVKKVCYFDNIDELKNNYFKKEKYLYYKDLNNDNKVVAIEFKYKKRIIRKILLFVLVLVVLFGVFSFVSGLIADYKSDKLKKEINDIQKEVSYVVIEINPKMILEIIDGNVSKSGCLNQDCQTIFQGVNVIGKSLNEVANILYNEAKDSGVDVSNGVSISSTNEKLKDEVKDISYVIYKHITNEEEKKYIDNVLDNNEIKEQHTKEAINNRLLEIYKNDNDYGKLYTCNIDNSELFCYITSEFEEILSAVGTYEETLDEYYKSINYVRKFENILEKFNIKYNSSGVEGLDISLIKSIYIGDVEYNLSGQMCYGSTTVSIDGPSSSMESCYNKIGLTIFSQGEASDLYKVVLPLSKFNLVSLNYKDSDLEIITIDKETNMIVVTHG